jgi:hypothetical protein
MALMRAVCCVHFSLFDLVILTIIGEDLDYTVFSSPYFVLYFIVPLVGGFELCLCGTAVFTARVMNEYEA